jgi:glutamyl-tRNA reductase
VSLAAIRDARSRQRTRPLLLIDLAMPRNVEAAAGKLENVFLYNLDDLALVAAKNREARLAEAESGRRTIMQRSDSLWLQLQLQFATLPEERPVDVPLTFATLSA